MTNLKPVSVKMGSMSMPMEDVYLIQFHQLTVQKANTILPHKDAKIAH